MKYTITILAVLAFASCKKDYTCRCTGKDGSLVSTGEFKLSKKEVDQKRTSCKGEEGWFTTNYPDKAPITCTLE